MGQLLGFEPPPIKNDPIYQNNLMYIYGKFIIVTFFLPYLSQFWLIFKIWLNLNVIIDKDLIQAMQKAKKP